MLVTIFATKFQWGGQQIFACLIFVICSNIVALSLSRRNIVVKSRQQTTNKFESQANLLG